MRTVKQLTLFLLLHFPLFAKAYVGMPLTKLSEKGVTLSALPGQHKESVKLSATVPNGMRLTISLNGNIPTSIQEFTRAITLIKTTPVTIALYENGKRSDTLYCGTYIINFVSTLPITTLILPPADLFDPTRGIYVGGMTPGGKRWGNCWGSQERQAFFELYEEGETALAQGVGLRIFGGMTRQNAEKSLRVIARKKYGKGKFKHRVFSTKDVDEFNSLVLRTSGNDWMRTRFQDMMISSLAKDMNIDYMAYQPSVLIVNGEYWGIHNIREKINMSYLEENHGADPEKTNLIQDLGTVATHGSVAGYKELFQFLSSNNPNQNGFVDSVEKRMDIDNYFKYLCLQIQIRNIDSRGNVRYWQAKNLDNRFRWIYYDGDLGFGGAQSNYLKDRLSPVQTVWHNPTPTTFLLRHLTANRSLRDRFVSQYCTLLTTWLQADTMATRIYFFKSLLEPEIERHLKRKGFNQTKDNWLRSVNHLISFSAIRMRLAYDHLSSNFGLGAKFRLVLQSPAPADKLTYAIERIPIPSHPYQGVFFKDAQVNVSVGFIHPRYRFVKWENGSTESTRKILSPKDSVVTLSAKIEEIPPSSMQGAYWINSIGYGKKEQPRFIEINGRNSSTDSLWIVDSRKSLSISLQAKTFPLVITEDTVAFKKQFPQASVSLFQYKKLMLKHLGETLFLLNPTGALIDSISLPVMDSSSKKKPFWIRNDEGKLVASKKQPSFQLGKAPWYRKNTFLFTLLAGGCIVILSALFRRKRNKDQPQSLLTGLLLLIGLSNTPSQMETDPVGKNEATICRN